jgi:hypothetical protein
MKTVLAFLVLAVLGASVAFAQTSRTFTARLSPVPIMASMQDTVAGLGSVTATLTGDRLVVDGKFNGLRSPATVARLHLAAPAMRGPAVHDLKVSSGTTGTISGTVELTGEERQALERGRIYIQLHSEKAPEGNLWGWLSLEGKK